MRIVDRRVLFRSREDLNFPRHFIYDDGRMALSFTRGRHSVYERTHFFVSEDGGRTWLTDLAYPFDHHIHFINRLSDGSLLTWGESGLMEQRFRRYFEAAVSHNEGRSWLVEHMPVEGGWERLTQFNRLLELQDGTLLQGVYGSVRGAGARQVHVVSRSPGETWWRPRGQVFQSRPGDPWEHSSEGAFERLPDGRLVCVARTGYPDSPLVQSWSEDEGCTWTPARCLEHSGVAPQLLLMDNGLLLLLFGARRANKLDGAMTALTSDDGGETWSEGFILYDGPGSSYGCVVATGPDRCLVTYSAGRFRRPELPQYTDPGEFNEICAATLAVER